jgi:hypothetical protein
MHYPTLLLPIIGGVLAPIVWATSCYLRGQCDSYSMLVLCWVACLYVAYKDNQQPKRLFTRTGKGKARSHAVELIIKGPGKGDNFFTSQRELAFADLEDFQYTEGKRVSFAELLRSKPFTLEPYCLDDETQSVIMVETPPGFDCAMVGPFYFATQRSVAQKLYAIPYEEFNEVCENLGEIDMSKLILLYNTSRCGSTLVSKGFDAMANIQSISEPDMFTSMTHMAMECKEDPEVMKELTGLARSTARLMLHIRTRRYPDRPILALKFRFQVINIAHMLHDALPQAKSMFLYRNGTDVIDSMGAAFINGGLYRLMRFLHLDQAYVFHFSALPIHLYKLIPLFGYRGFPCETFEMLGACSPFTMGWLSVMEKAYDCLQQGQIQLAFRYEDLVDQQAGLLTKVLRQAGFSPKGNKQALESVFGKDSQHLSVAQSSRRVNGVFSDRYAYLRKGDVANINAVIAQHPTIHTEGFILPSTVC